MVLYEGIFFDDKTTELISKLDKNPLEIKSTNLHCTFKFLPKNDEIFNNLANRQFDIYLIGYGNDGSNSGFEVSLPEELNKYYINYEKNNPTILKTPHITTSLSDGAKPANTKNLEFKKLDNPIKITGKFGFWLKDDDKQYLSYEPYIKTHQN